MDDLSRRLASNLKRLRKAEGLSQEELAARASLHRTEIGLLERGIRKPRLDSLLKLAGALGTDANALVEGIHWVPVAPRRGAFAFDSPAGQFMRRGEADKKGSGEDD
jgi:transcriptional regulator with XRE-family HTH domain